MNPLDTFSSIASPTLPDGNYYPLQARERVPYTGDPKQYAFGPEHLFWQSVAPPVIPDDPTGVTPWTPPGSAWDMPYEDNGPSGDSADPAGPTTDPNASPDPGPFGNLSAPTMDNITNTANAVTSPFGKAVSLAAPFGSIAQGLAHGAEALANRAKTVNRNLRENIYQNEFSPSGNTGSPGTADPGSHGATGGMGPGGMGGRGGQHGADPTGGMGPGGMGGSPSGGGDASDPSTSGGTGGQGDSDGAPSGTWHQGGPVYDGNPQTYRQDMPIVAQEGEYVLPRYVVDAFGIDALDMLRKAVAPNGDMQYGSGEMKALPETLARHKPQGLS